MKKRDYEVWFVDDLTENLERFKKNHSGDFKVIRTFKKTTEVLSLIRQNIYPDALLVDVFFYPTEEEAQRAEDEVAERAKQLRTTAAELGLADHTLTAGITLMEQIYKHFGNKHPEFPMYAYTSKGPFLLEQKDWKNISTYGAQVLLKGRVSPEIEATEIVGDIENQRAKNSWTFRIRKWARSLLLPLWPGLFWLIVGWIGGIVSAQIGWIGKIVRPW